MDGRLPTRARRHRGGVGSRLRLAVAAGVVVGAAIAVPTTAPAAGTTPAGASLATAAPTAAGAADARTHPRRTPSSCAPVDHRFRPSRLAIPHVVGSTRVLSRGSDRWGVPKPPPLTDTGKWQFAWDRETRAGAPFGVVRLTAHTYPAFAGLALGNRLLQRLHKGALLLVGGPRGEQLCYRVTQRISVPATRTVRAYYSGASRARLGILVCSGIRRGPGDWSRRTIWFAKPIWTQASRR